MDARKEGPILFSGSMVRTLLDGSKGQTRRVVKPQPVNGWAFETPPVFGRITSPHPKRDRFGAFVRRGVGTDFPEVDLIPCPYGMPGDRLYVRETWAQPTTLDPGPTFYRADYPACVPSSFANVPAVDAIAWKPSIHMPRALSRISIEVTKVRIERLQDISEADAHAEGTLAGAYEYDNGEGTETARESFEHLWDSLNDERGHGWNTNPWVWVVEFRRV